MLDEDLSSDDRVAALVQLPPTESVPCRDPGTRDVSLRAPAAVRAALAAVVSVVFEDVPGVLDQVRRTPRRHDQHPVRCLPGSGSSGEWITRLRLRSGSTGVSMIRFMRLPLSRSAVQKATVLPYLVKRNDAESRVAE